MVRKVDNLSVTLEKIVFVLELCRFHFFFLKLKKKERNQYNNNYKGHQKNEN